LGSHFSFLPQHPQQSTDLFFDLGRCRVQDRRVSYVDTYVALRQSDSARSPAGGSRYPSGPAKRPSASALNFCQPGWAKFLNEQIFGPGEPQIENGLQPLIEGFNGHRTSHKSISDSVRQYYFAADRAPARCALLRFKVRSSGIVRGFLLNVRSKADKRISPARSEARTRHLLLSAVTASASGVASIAYAHAADIFDAAYTRKTASPIRTANEATVNESQKRSGVINRSPQAESGHSFLKARHLGLNADSLATSEPFLQSALTAS
jgi:hypothetical protein